MALIIRSRSGDTTSLTMMIMMNPLSPPPQKKNKGAQRFDIW